MNTADVRELSTLLHALYGAYRFPGLEAAMLDLWYDALAPFDANVVRRAVRQWARHHTNKPPSLDELQEAAERIVDDDRRSRLPATPKGPVEVLQDVAELVAERSPDDGVFARCMCRLAERYPRAQWPQQCRLWAIHYAPQRPALATWLEQAAQQYERLLPTAVPGAPPPPARVIPQMFAATPVSSLANLCPHEHLHESGECNDCGQLVTAAAGD